jgi:hypothetical protein
MKTEWRKPQLIKVALMVEQTVLGSCKTSTALFGPGLTQCGYPGIMCSQGIPS